MSKQSSPIPIKIPKTFQQDPETKLFIEQLTRSAQLLREEVKPQEPIKVTQDYTTCYEDRGKTLEVDGTHTVTLCSGSIVKAGYGVTVKNIGTGTVTVDVENGEPIDDQTSINLSTTAESITAQVNKDADAYRVIGNYDPTPLPTFGSLATKDKIVKSDVDFTDWRGMSPVHYDFGSTDAVSTSFTDVAGRSMYLYIPADVTRVIYSIELQGISGSTTSYGRLRTSSANGTVVQTSNSSFTWMKNGSLDVSSINNTEVEIFVQHRSDGTLANAKIRKVSAYIGL